MSELRHESEIHRNTLYARRIRAALIVQLGGKCKLCPESDPDKLQFDHIDGRNYNPNKLSYSARLARYKREADFGELRLLCGPCNLSERKKHEDGSFCRTEHEPVTTNDFPY